MQLKIHFIQRSENFASTHFAICRFLFLTRSYIKDKVFWLEEFSTNN